MLGIKRKEEEKITTLERTQWIWLDQTEEKQTGSGQANLSDKKGMRRKKMRSKKCKVIVIKK